LRASQEYGDDGLGRDDVKDFFNDVYPSIRSATTAEDSFLLWTYCRDVCNKVNHDWEDQAGSSNSINPISKTDSPFDCEM
jgi:hypothetical protein